MLLKVAQSTRVHGKADSTVIWIYIHKTTGGFLYLTCNHCQNLSGIWRIIVLLLIGDGGKPDELYVSNAFRLTCFLLRTTVSRKSFGENTGHGSDYAPSSAARSYGSLLTSIAVTPPSTTILAPVMASARSLSKKATISPTSGGSITRSIGILLFQ